MLWGPAPCDTISCGRCHAVIAGRGCRPSAPPRSARAPTDAGVGGKSESMKDWPSRLHSALMCAIERWAASSACSTPCVSLQLQQGSP